MRRKRPNWRFLTIDDGGDCTNSAQHGIGEDMKDVEFSWPIGMPLVRSLGRDIWEVRSSLPHGRMARVLFCVEQECMVLLHEFMKKTQKTPKQDIDLVIRRKKGTGT